MLFRSGPLDQAGNFHHDLGQAIEQIFTKTPRRDHRFEVLVRGANDPGVHCDRASPTDPLANPLKADLAGLPPVYVNAGSSEVLLSDTTRFAEAAIGSGVDVTVSVVEGMQHVFPVLAGRAPIVDDEIAKVANWYQQLATIPCAA